MLRLSLLPLMFGALLQGCAQPTHLVHYSRTIVGFDAALATQPTGGHMLLGYDRRTVEVVPKTKADDRTDALEAMSVLSCTKIRAKGVRMLEFSERLATGDAATEYTRDGGRALAKDNPFHCFKAEVVTDGDEQ